MLGSTTSARRAVSPQHEVDDDQQVEALQPLGDVRGPGRGDHRVRAEDQQRLGPSAVPSASSSS
ncbi:hypothetical protein [Nonomuraea dietziae]|uniref:hypothetical protein n=1 Tax=Nonomuraea dietziae TaxID=65515 RepID=UPI0031D18FDD